MIRLLLAAAVLCGLVVLAVSGIGRAIDTEIENRVLITQNGATWDCERFVYPDGRVAYGNCHIVP